MVTLYGIKNCDSVKKAVAFLKAHSIDFDFVDFKTTPPTIETLTSWVEKSDISTLFNAKSRTYKELGLSKEHLTPHSKMAHMINSPLLIKRPVIEYKNQLIVGFNSTTYEEIFNDTRS